MKKRAHPERPNISGPLILPSLFPAAKANNPTFPNENPERSGPQNGSQRKMMKRKIPIFMLPLAAILKLAPPL